MVIIVRTDEGLPKPKYIFNKCAATNIYFFALKRFGPSPSPNFKFLKMHSLYICVSRDQALKPILCGLN